MKRDTHLPLTETTYYILLALTQPAHGYAAIQTIEKMSGGDVKVAAGTMYGAIEKLLKLKWIKEVPSEDRRRRVYTITDLGKQILTLETSRMRELTRVAATLGY